MDPTEQGLRQEIAYLTHIKGDWQTPALVLSDYLEQVERLPEARVLRELVERGVELRSSDWPRFLASNLTEHQVAGANRAMSRRVGILIGGPGTGKTRVIAALVKAWPDNLQPRLALCAPTGRAAVRMRESIEAAGCDWIPETRTIHQTLGIGRNGHDGRGWGFVYDDATPLPYQFLIVDEASMLDANLAACLLQAVRTGGHVLFVGDPGQLPPVGHGAPLRDLIAAGVPCGELTEVHRNAGLIAETCAAIRQGKPFPEGKPGDVVNLHWLSVHARQVEEEVVKFAARWTPADCQVICATNAQRERLNKLLAVRLNPGAPRDAKQIAAEGDKVICTANGWYPGPQGMQYVANGELGRCLGVASSNGRSFDAQFGDRSVNVHSTLARDAFDLGFAITGHRAQGSQWPTTIIAADDSGAAARICTREWWYTVISRAQLACYVVGPLATIERQCQRESTERRMTFLKELLEGQG